jgi:hypothetical protein
MDLRSENFRDWLPVRVYENGGGLFADWIFLGRKRFTEPFHDSTLEIPMRMPFNLLFQRQTPIEFFDEFYEKSPGIAPNGFIFHISRCGSTLVSQMFAALEKNIVISEASVIDRLIRADVSEERKIIWLRGLFNALAQKRFPAEENFFVKFDSWSVFDLPLIENAFPEVPWIFMYRNPVEVIVSQMRQSGMQMVPGQIAAIFPNMEIHEILQFSTEERFARTIAAFCEAGLKNAASRHGKFINYTQLPEAVTGEICSHFRVSFSDEEIEKMKSASRLDAKNPRQQFFTDGEEKRREANEKIVYFADKIVAPLYEKLENIRLQKMSDN